MHSPLLPVASLTLFIALAAANPAPLPSATATSPLATITSAPIFSAAHLSEELTEDAIRAHHQNVVDDELSLDLRKRQVNGCGVYAVFCDAAQIYCCDIGKACIYLSSQWKCQAANYFQLQSQYSFIQSDLRDVQSSVDSVLFTNPTYVPTALINYLAAEAVTPLPTNGAAVANYVANALAYLQSFTQTYTVPTSSDGQPAFTSSYPTDNGGNSSSSNNGGSQSATRSVGLAIGAIVGIAIGGIILFGLIFGGLIACCLIKRRRRRRAGQNYPQGANGPMAGTGHNPMGMNTGYQPTNQFQPNNQFTPADQGVGYAAVPQHDKAHMLDSTNVAHGAYAPMDGAYAPVPLGEKPIHSPAPSYSQPAVSPPISSVGVTNPDINRHSMVSQPSTTNPGDPSHNPSTANSYHNPSVGTGQMHGASMVTPPLPGHNEVYGNAPNRYASPPPPQGYNEVHGNGPNQYMSPPPQGFNEVQGNIHHPQNVQMGGQPSPPAVYGANEAYAGLPPQELPHMRY